MTFYGTFFSNPYGNIDFIIISTDSTIKNHFFVLGSIAAVSFVLAAIFYIACTLLDPGFVKSKFNIIV